MTDAFFDDTTTAYSPRGTVVENQTPARTQTNMGNTLGLTRTTRTMREADEKNKRQERVREEVRNE